MLSDRSLGFAATILILFGTFVSPTTTYAKNIQEQLSKEAFAAIKEGNRPRVQELLSQGLDPNYKLGEPRNLMRLSVGFGRAAILEDLIQAGGNVDHKLKDNMYFATYVSLKNDLQFLKPVLAQNPDLNRLMYVNQFTAFTGMLRSISEGTLKFVISNSNADVNFRPENGLSALFLAYERGKCGLKCVEVLLEHGANPCLEIGPNGESFMQYLMDRGQTTSLENVTAQDCTRAF
ncbi:hypothetical protein SAMN04487880_1560 [Marinobacter sp. es.042]|nr:hypothetical protein SAMN04487880_1560 [Marinobacter sp. es.042]